MSVPENDHIGPPEAKLDQSQPDSSSASSKDASPEKLQSEHVLHSNEKDPGQIGSVGAPVDPNEVPKNSTDALPANDTIVTIQCATSRSGSSIQSANLDNPFALFETAERLLESVRTFAFRHDLMDALGELQRAALVERDEMEAFQDPDFPANERTALEKEKEATFGQQSRSLRGTVLIVGALSGACQGWAQSMLNGSGICTKEESS